MMDKLEELRNQFEKQRHGDDKDQCTPIDGASTGNFFEQYRQHGSSPQSSRPVIPRQESGFEHEDWFQRLQEHAIAPYVDPGTSRIIQKRNGYSNMNSNKTPWRAIVYLIVAIIAIMLIVTIWNARYAILDSIMDFIWLMLPAILTIGLLIWAFKKLITGK